MNEIVTEALGQIIIRNSNPKPWPFELLQVCNIFRFFIQNSKPKPTNAWLFPSPLAAIWNSSYSRCCRTIFGVKNIRWYGLRRKVPDWQIFLVTTPQKGGLECSVRWMQQGTLKKRDRQIRSSRSRVNKKNTENKARYDLRFARVWYLFLRNGIIAGWIWWYPNCHLSMMISKLPEAQFQFQKNWNQLYESRYLAAINGTWERQGFY